METTNTNTTDATRQQDADYNANDLPWNTAVTYTVDEQFREAVYSLNGVAVTLCFKDGEEQHAYLDFGSTATEPRAMYVTRNELWRLRYLMKHSVLKSWMNGHSPTHATALHAPERQQYNAALTAAADRYVWYGEAPDQPIPLLTAAPGDTVQALYCTADHSVSVLEYTNGDGLHIARALDPHDNMEQIVTLGIMKSEPLMELQISDVRRLRDLLNHPDVAYLLDTPVDTIVQTDPRIAHDPRIQHARTRLAAGLAAFPNRSQQAPIIGCTCKACTEIAAAHPDTPAVPA